MPVARLLGFTGSSLPSRFGYAHGMGKNSTASVPHVVSLIICEKVLQTKTGSSFVFHGVLHSVPAIGFPVRIDAGLAILVELTQGRGDVDLQVRLRHRERDDCVVYDELWKFKFFDPFDLLIQWDKPTPITFPGPGPYVLEAVFNGIPISSRRLMLGMIDATPGNPRGGPA